MDASVSKPIEGIAWMAITGVLFIAVTVLVKLLGPRIPAAEAAFLRYLIGLVFVIPIARQLSALTLKRSDWALIAGRGTAHSFAIILWFYAITVIPIAEVTAIGYLNPIYVTIGAALFLGETLAARRIAAVIVALLGALVILRPGFREISPGHIAMLGTALMFAASYLGAKKLSDRFSPSMVVGMLSLSVTVVLFPFALMDWVWPNARELLILSAVALVATIGHYTMTRAFTAAPMTVTQPVTFLQLLWSVILGALFFDEAVDFWVLIGGAIILAAVTFITWREAVLRRKPVTPPSPATKV